MSKTFDALMALLDAACDGEVCPEDDLSNT